MKPIPSIDLVGAGITGLMIAWFINQADPNIDIVIYDAQPDPRKSLRSKDNSPTFGGDPLANCIRQITGTEGLVLPRADAMHFEALPGNPFVDKLVIAPDNGQNVRRDTFVQIDGAMNYFEPVYDVEKNSLHSQINYASLELWLALSNANLSKFLFSCKTVDIFHINKENFDADLLTEEQLYWHGTNSETISSPNTGQPFFLRSVYDNHLVLPGASVDSRSFALALLNELSRKENVTINFNRRISKIKNTQGLVILANNGVHRNIGQQRLTSLGGYWASVDNTKLGITKPFKLALDPPIGYVNVTPNSNGRLSISGGLNQIGYFGAMGDAMLQAGKQAFLDAIKEYFDIDEIQSEYEEDNRKNQGRSTSPIEPVIFGSHRTDNIRLRLCIERIRADAIVKIFVLREIERTVFCALARIFVKSGPFEGFAAKNPERVGCIVRISAIDLVIHYSISSRNIIDRKIPTDFNAMSIVIGCIHQADIGWRRGWNRCWGRGGLVVNQ